MSQEYHVEFPTRTAVHVEEGQPLGEVRMLVEQVAGNVTQSQINIAVAEYIEEHPGVLTGLTEETKVALMSCFAAILACMDEVGWATDNGDTLYDALQTAIQNLRSNLYPERQPVSIEATYTQTGTVTSATNLDSLKSDLVVIANYDSGSPATLSSSDYTLSGTLTAGTTSTITVTYEELTDTFDVVVSSIIYNWDFTQSLTDTVAGKVLTPTAGSGHTVPQRGSSGLEFTEATQKINIENVSFVGRTVEMDIASFSFAGNSDYHVRLLMNASSGNPDAVGYGALIFRSGYGWSSYGCKDSNTSHTGTSYRIWSSTGWGSLYATDKINAFNGTTVKVVFGSDGHTRKLYVDNELVATMTNIYFNHHSTFVTIGGIVSYDQTKGDQCYDMTLTGLRIYANEGSE